MQHHINNTTIYGNTYRHDYNNWISDQELIIIFIVITYYYFNNFIDFSVRNFYIIMIASSRKKIVLR